MNGLDFLYIMAGISLLVWVKSMTKIQQMKAQYSAWYPQRNQAQDSAILQEIRTLKEQVNAIQSTGHQFDISFDEALCRLEHRVGRLEQQVSGRTAVEPESMQTSSLLG